MTNGRESLLPDVGVGALYVGFSDGRVEKSELELSPSWPLPNQTDQQSHTNLCRLATVLPVYVECEKTRTARFKPQRV